MWNSHLRICSLRLYCGVMNNEEIAKIKLDTPSDYIPLKIDEDIRKNSLKTLS